jgi:uncharacterized protein YecE (DUF72 family)
MPGTLRVGCPQWTERSWIKYLPPGASGPWSLQRYASLCTAVEGNTTFYALPTAASVARWRSEVDDDFRFCFKLPREVTHDAGLRGQPPELATFFERIEPLLAVLGPTSIQLPASFGPDQLPTLTSFLDRLPQDWPWAVEVRHPDFFADPFGPRLDEVLRHAGVDRVTLDSRSLFAGPSVTLEETEAFRRKPRLPVRPIRTGTQPIIRFIGQNDPAANPPFWQPWLRPVADWLADGDDVFVFVHTPNNVESPALARQFFSDVAELVPGLSPLPQPAIATAQPGLF